jgi:type IV fimbrial biogenesis protein FimT
MRYLTSPTAQQRGLTLVELMVGVAIAAFLMMTAAPYFSDYVTNSRLRENGHLVYGEALAAQSEAVKRNGTVRLDTAGDTVRVIARNSGGADVVLRTRTLSPGVTATTTTIDFGSEGRPVPLGTAGAVNLALSGITCSGDYRCPGLRVDGGGAVRLCANNTLASC